LVPIERAEPFRVALATGAGVERVASSAAAPPPETRHKVRRGDTLNSISRRYGVSIADLRAANNLRGSVIHPGETLSIPSARATAPAPVAEARPDIGTQLPERQAAAAPRARSHTVRPGETLWGVARRYGVTVPQLAAANSLSTQSQLTAGTRLEIPGAGAKATPETTRMTYKVRRGDTLSQIAERFSVSVRQIMTWNQIRQSTSLRAGQRIVVYVDPRKVSGG
jgi:membrane-bound lytic murein transglycosylase D